MIDSFLSAISDASIATLSTLIVGIAATITAFSSLVEVRNNRTMIEASLWPDFSRRYKTDEMARSIRLLIDFYFDNRENFLEIWVRDFEAGESYAKDLDNARRVVSMYFLDIAYLYRDGIITKRFAKFIANQAGLNVFYEIVVPMNEKLRPARTREALKYLKQLHQSVEGGLVDFRRRNDN